MFPLSIKINVLRHLWLQLRDNQTEFVWVRRRMYCKLYVTTGAGVQLDVNLELNSVSPGQAHSNFQISLLMHVGFTLTTGQFYLHDKKWTVYKLHMSHILPAENPESLFQVLFWTSLRNYLSVCISSHCHAQLWSGHATFLFT